MADIVSITPWSVPAGKEAAHILRAGGLVAVPTETVYGLAADAANDRAVARIYEAKGRPSFNPLIVHVEDRTMAEAIAVFPPLARKLADAFWPGALTLVLPVRSGARLSKLVTAGLDTVAVRCPAADPARTVLHYLGRPFAAPSANPSGSLSPTTAAHVAAGLGDKVDMILDDGPCPVGVESTILAVNDGLRLLRPGGVALDALVKTIGQDIEIVTENSAILAPGMMESHYAPAARLRLDAEAPGPGEAFLGFGERQAEPGLNLSPSGDLVEAAANLFDYLHRLDADHERIAVAPIPMEGLGLAINDRLRRAAAPKGSPGATQA